MESMMKTPLIFLALDALMVIGYSLALLATLIRRIFSRRTKV
jgi:hypothetical protein